ncbi:hypothetical protein Tsubulata_048057 [Turnera subulata]|uniref:WHY domain class transcription factor n=1 Tax=Turnera subulata TaxID=218843 RepID=A0A9Q0GAP8_9ROSI|nr:hypothetical protein Tsubulata_048057 [Turnera subulata]
MEKMLLLQLNPIPCFNHRTLPSSHGSVVTTPFAPNIHSLPLLPGGNSNTKGCRKFAVKSRQVDYEKQQQQSISPSRKSPNGQLPPKVFVSHSIYKGKAALTVEPRPPQFSTLESGAIRVSKEGILMLQFAPATGLRQYDWTRKQVFSLSVAEIGSLISLGAKDSCEIFHDPNIGRSDEGKVRKLLRVEPLPDAVHNKFTSIEESIYVPVTKAEFAVLMTACNYILPHLLGWNAFANSIRPDDAGRMNNASSRSGGESEWER